MRLALAFLRHKRAIPWSGVEAGARRAGHEPTQVRPRNAGGRFGWPELYTILFAAVPAVNQPGFLAAMMVRADEKAQLIAYIAPTASVIDLVKSEQELPHGGRKREVSEIAESY